MADTDADARSEMSEALPEGSERNSPVAGSGASNPTAREDRRQGGETGITMEQVLERANMERAYRRVVTNGGAPGIDGMETEELLSYLQDKWEPIKSQLLAGTYRPEPVRQAQIPKPGGGTRTLGIPTALDRMIQQALHQALTPIFDPSFSDRSYGFRPGRSAHQAVRQTQQYVQAGRRWVVDLDLASFFDRVNHDVLMARVARKVEDPRILGLIRRYLQAGALTRGMATVRREGTPQGGPLSPLLSNILLDELDNELERRGHAFCRYADDFQIYVCSQKAATRVKASVTRWLKRVLRLEVNPEKSAVGRPSNRPFLGYVFWGREAKPKVAPQSERRLKRRLRTVIRASRGKSLSQIIAELTPILRGWIQYFRLAEVKAAFERLDQWIRRRCRCVLWRQWKRAYTRARHLMAQGLAADRSWRSATNGRGPWWNSGASHMNQAVPTKALTQMGLFSLLHAHLYLRNHS